MSDNILQTVQHLVQDVISPDVRELKANQAVLQKQITDLQKYMDVRFNLSDQKSDAQFNALLSAISESRAQAETYKPARHRSLSERVAVLEAQRH
jgi:uncharacterized protein YlxP (DUF503 family)